MFDFAGASGVPFSAACNPPVTHFARHPAEAGFCICLVAEIGCVSQEHESFWRRVSEAARFSPFRRGPLDVLLGRWTLDSSPAYVAIDLMSRLLSPYDLNPMGGNP